VAKNSRNQRTGRRGETAVWTIFEDLGYVCNDIADDFGEDFFVYAEEDEIIEPFKIFIQVKASDEFDKNPSDWTEYCDALTVRNWILSNELTIVVRKNLKSGEIRYAIPEEEFEYWKLDPDTKFPVRMLKDFDATAAKRVMWKARVRHYERLVRLTMPNPFETHEFEGIPKYRLFLLELLFRMGVLDHGDQFSAEFVKSYNRLHADCEATFTPSDAADMSPEEQLRYMACLSSLQVALIIWSGHTLEFGRLVLDQLACLLVQFVIPQEQAGALRKLGTK
jgi:hypothetical protein